MPVLVRLAFACLLFAAPAFAAEQSYLTPSQVDLVRLLPPPPTPGSALDRAEMEEVVTLGRTRSPERAAQATADANESVADMFGAVLGPRFALGALPLTAKFFEKLAETEETVIGAAKSGFARPRPYLANPALNPVAPRSRSGSYPSGHASRVTVVAVALAAMVPEQRTAIFERASDYAESRVIASVHYRSDIVAGRQAGTAINAVLANDAGFIADFGPARAELRAALGLAN